MKSTPLSVVCLLFVCVCSQGLMANQPNVVVILTDDQGWGDLSVNGNANIATPNIDSLARDGAGKTAPRETMPAAFRKSRRFMAVLIILICENLSLQIALSGRQELTSDC